jgi:hypothetical protein
MSTTKEQDKTREILINKISKDLNWLIQFEAEKLLNENDSALHFIPDDVLNVLVNHWYTCREKSIFMNEQGVEVDEYLSIEDYYVYNK